MDPLYLEVLKTLGGIALAWVAWIYRDLQIEKKKNFAISERLSVAETRLSSVVARQEEDRQAHTAQLEGFREDIKQINDELKLIRKDFGAELRAFGDRLVEVMKKT